MLTLYTTIRNKLFFGCIVRKAAWVNNRTTGKTSGGRTRGRLGKMLGGLGWVPQRNTSIEVITNLTSNGPG